MSMPKKRPRKRAWTNGRNPPKKAAAPPAEPIECCRHWMRLSATEREQWPFQVLHHFGHSRTAFSVATLAETAKVSDERARDLAREGEAWKWIWETDRDIWVGMLTRRR